MYTPEKIMDGRRKDTLKASGRKAYRRPDILLKFQDRSILIFEATHASLVFRVSTVRLLLLPVESGANSLFGIGVFKTQT